MTAVWASVLLMLAGTGARASEVLDQQVFSKQLASRGFTTACTESPTQPSAPIFGVFKVAWSNSLLGTAALMPVPGDVMTIRASILDGYACVTLPNRHGGIGNVVTLQMEVDSSQPGGEMDHIFYAFSTPQGDGYSFTFFAYPEPGNDANFITASYFHDGVLSADSAGTWGGGK